ncbi:hypothetical protein [Kitasatospora sp. NPDC101183]|uniref:hypothetical protein n=1 Tax=Kitasatospora sp. NPDC101183 TaxID=3364100 RepID=UPI003804E26A
MGTIDGLGALQKALLSALDQMGAAISAVLQADKDMVFVHQSPGIPIDPKEYENPWTVEGGDVYALLASGGDVKIPQVQQPPAPATPASGTTTTTKKPPPPPPPDPNAEVGINSAVATSHFANLNLQLGTSIAVYGPGTVSDAWGLVAGAVFADKPPDKPQAQEDAIKQALAVLYVRPGAPTPGYQTFRKDRTTVTGLIGKKAAAFVAAMGDPAKAAAFPLGDGKVFDQQIQDAETDLNAADLAAGPMSYSQAEAFINAQGVDIVVGAVDAVKQRWLLFGQTSAAVGQFAYTTIDPPSWCQSTDDSFGPMQIDVSDSTYDSASANTFNAFSSSYYNASSQSDTGGVGIVYGPFSATADVGFSSAKAAGGFASGSSAGAVGWDKSSSASISGEFFLATIDRPWLFDEIFRVGSGWHITDKGANYLSDGTNTAANNANFFPAVPVQILVARNVAISCDDWGDFQTFATSFAQSAASQQSSSGTTYGGSVGAFGLGVTYNHQDASTDGSQFGQDDGSSSWSYQTTDSGGTLSIHGTQVLGWALHVTPPSPTS